MASTATNKQPLLVDRVFHEVYSLNDSTILQTDVTGTNFAQLLLNCSTNDGAVIEDIYLISRGQDSNTQDYVVNLYLSSDTDFLRPAQQSTGAVSGGVYVGSITADSTPGVWTHNTNMPDVLAPVPHVGTAQKLRAFYVPKGKNLWAARLTNNLTDTETNAPIIGVSGGFY